MYKYSIIVKVDTPSSATLPDINASDYDSYSLTMGGVVTPVTATNIDEGISIQLPAMSAESNGSDYTISGTNANGTEVVAAGKIYVTVSSDTSSIAEIQNDLATKADLSGATFTGPVTAPIRDNGGQVFDIRAFATPQAAIDAAPSGSIIAFPTDNSTITAPLSITKSGLTLKGVGYYRSRIFASGCNGIEVAAGVSDLRMENIEVACSVRYSTTPNSLIAVKINGSSANHCQNFTFRDVYCDGFQTAFYCRYLWNSEFANCRSGFGLIGLASYGLSVNNRIISGALNVAGAGTVAGSRCVALLGYESDTDATPVASEGWRITSGTLLDGGEIGVEITGTAHVDVADNIIDHCGLHGVLIQGDSAGVHFGGNCDVHDNYIAMATTAGIAAIRNANTVANSTLKRTRVHHNLITVYSGASCTYGINQSGNNGQMIIDGNSALGFTTADIFVQSTGNIVGPNDLKSAIANNCSAPNPNSITNVEGSNGHVFLPGAGAGSPFAYRLNGNNKVASWFGPPTINTWAVGDTIYNVAPASGQPMGWVCTVAGTPGTWVALANLA